MTWTPNQEKRRILPRWRTYARTIINGELDSSSLGKVKNKISREDVCLDEKILEWKTKGATVDRAVDILSSSIIIEEGEKHTSYAWWLLLGKEKIAPAVVALAEACTKPELFGQKRATVKNLSAMQLLQATRASSRNHIGDATIFIDKALAHTMLGDGKSAEKAVKIALQLEPNNRFVLRSASRFFVHFGNNEMARDILLRSERTKADPWLAAAEVAISSYSDKPIRNIKSARSIIENKQGNARQLSELAASLGTLEALDGRRKRARDYFHLSLIDPTENALAQTVWAEKANVAVNFNLQMFDHLRPSEAEAWSARAKLDWRSTIISASSWSFDEPYSKAPVLMSSYASAVIGQYEQAMSILKSGINANPSDFLMRNNFVFNAARLGLQSEAEHHMHWMVKQKLSDTDHMFLLAIAGLYEFRFGSVKAGRNLYRSAINSGLVTNNHKLAALASAFWVQEEVALYGFSDIAECAKIFSSLEKHLTEPEYCQIRMNTQSSLKYHLGSVSRIGGTLTNLLRPHDPDLDKVSCWSHLIDRGSTPKIK